MLSEELQVEDSGVAEDWNSCTECKIRWMLFMEEGMTGTSLEEEDQHKHNPNKETLLLNKQLTLVKKRLVKRWIMKRV